MDTLSPLKEQYRRSTQKQIINMEIEGDLQVTAAVGDVAVFAVVAVDCSWRAH